MALVEKAEAIRAALGLPAGLVIPEIIARAEAECGIHAQTGGLLQRAGVLCSELGVGVVPKEATFPVAIEGTAVAGAVVAEAVVVGSVGVAVVANPAPVVQQMDREYAAPRPGHRGYSDPPNLARPRYFGNRSYFWRYYKAGCEGCPCEHGAYCKALFAAPFVHAEIADWTGDKSYCAALSEWLACWPFLSLCMIEGDRNKIERKIHAFHHERGDPGAQGQPFRAGEGVIGVGMLCGPCVVFIMHAQNYWVMKEFQRVQAPHL